MGIILAVLAVFTFLNSLGVVFSLIFTRAMGITVTMETDRKLDKLVQHIFGVERE